MLVAILAAGLVQGAQPEPGVRVIQGFGPTLAKPACQAATIQTAAPVDPALLLRPQDRARVKYRRLGELPKANHEIAVLRQVEGCTAPVVVSYEVELDGRAAGGQ